MAQDTYCRLIEKSAGLLIETPRTYLTTLARRLLIDDIRRRDLKRAILDDQAGIRTLDFACKWVAARALG